MMKTIMHGACSKMFLNDDDNDSVMFMPLPTHYDIESIKVKVIETSMSIYYALYRSTVMPALSVISTILSETSCKLKSSQA